MYVGIPITQNILGMDMVPCTVLVIAFVIPIYNILGVATLAGYGPSGEKVDKKRLLLDILKNPLIIAILVGVPLSLFGWRLPAAVHESLDYLGSIATPLALLFIGGSIRYREFLENLWLSIKAAALKVIVQPLLFVPLALWLGFNPEEVVTIYVMLAVPTALNAYIVTRKLGGDQEVAAGTIVATLLLSVATIPIGIVLMRRIGLI